MYLDRVRCPRNIRIARLTVARLALVSCLGLLFPGAASSLAKPQRPRRGNPRPHLATATVYLTTSDMRETVAPQPTIHFSASKPAGTAELVTVNDHHRFQRFEGIGGAMTDTSAWLLETQLSSSLRDEWMNALFSAAGVHLSFLRVPMGASDFTAQQTPYTYDDEPSGQSDPSLAHFSIAHDSAYIVPALREALELNPRTFVLANPWSPPPWMKANDAYGNLRKEGLITPAALPSFADYFVKFIEAYQAQGIKISAVTPENEPGASVNYPSANLQPSDEADFVANDLAPALKAAGLSAVKVYGYDGSWGAYPFRLLSTSAANRFAGIAWHCYVNNPGIMNNFHHWRPSVDQMVDECATPVRASTAQLMIASLRNWASRVVTWNLALDQNGGPVERPNIVCYGCTGLITVNTRTHTASPSLDLYQLAQLSHFVEPGAVRIASNAFSDQDVNPRPSSDNQRVAGRRSKPGLNDVAFRNPQGQTVLVAYNNSSSVQPFTVSDSHQYFRYVLLPGAMATFMWTMPRARR